MKKIVFILVALFATISLSAQTVEKSKFFDNMYIGVNTGASSWLHPTCNGFENFGKSIKSLSSLRVGKMVTPVFGLELEGEVGMANKTTFVDHTVFGGNMLVNVNNLVHPYRGESDKVEFVPFLGIGWHHTYGIITNNISSKMGVQLNFNLDEKQSWQINVIPSLNYIMTDNGFSDGLTGQPRFDICRSYLNLQVGVTYKFKNSNGTHNFKISPFTYTQEDIDELMDEINSQRELIRKKSNALKATRKKIIELNDNIDSLETKNVELERINQEDIMTTIGFAIGESDINEIQRGNLIRVSEMVKNNNLKIKIIGYADKETGSEQRNLELSNMRAISVAKALNDLGVDEGSMIIDWVGSEEQVFDENDANRVVIFTIEQ